jgi:hypothetical protein
MVVNDFDLLRAIIPNEADAVLVIDADAVLALTVTVERFEVIARRPSQVVQRDCGIQHVELSTGNLGKGAERFHSLAVEKRLRGFALDHELLDSVSRYPSNGMRYTDSLGAVRPT